MELENTFEADFLSSQPDLDFLKFLDKSNRAAFYTAFKRAFERYINDRLAAWEFMAKQKVAATFSLLDAKADGYCGEYAQVVEAMNRKLLSERFYAIGHSYQPDPTTTLTDLLTDLFTAIPDQLNGAIHSFNLFWQSILFYACVTIVLNIVGILFASLTLPLVGAFLLGMGIVTLQTETVRQQLVTATKNEFIKYLPKIAEEQWQPIYQSVKNCFDAYEQQVSDRINADITARKAELDNLLQQKRSHEINRGSEVQRFEQLEADLTFELKEIDLLMNPFTHD